VAQRRIRTCERVDEAQGERGVPLVVRVGRVHEHGDELAQVLLWERSVVCLVCSRRAIQLSRAVLAVFIPPEAKKNGQSSV
jgi:hypothetical protein